MHVCVYYMLLWLAQQVLTLVARMEKLRNEPLHPNIHSAMETWMEGIRKVQARRKEEIINATNRHRNNMMGQRHQEEKGEIGRKDMGMVD